MEFVFSYSGKIKDLDEVRAKIKDIYEPLRQKFREGEDKKGIPTKWNPLNVILIDEPENSQLIVTPKSNFVNLFERAKVGGFSASGAKFKSPVKRTIEEYVHKKIDINLGGRKWETLTHNGVYFGEPYAPLKVKVAGKIVPADDEEYLYMYAVRRASEIANENVVQYTKDLVFIKNYLNDLKDFVSKGTWNLIKGYVPKASKDIPAFNKIFDGLVEKIQEIKANKKKAGEKEKEKTEKIKRIYGFATVDGRVEKVGNFNVEKPGLLMGRGDNPRRGCLKPRIRSSDVTINIGESAKIPVPSDGGKWGNVVHNHDVTWLAGWEDRCGNTTKYVWLNPASAFKASNNQLKFEKARKLGQNVDDLEKEYLRLMASSSTKDKQLGTVVYLIHQFAFRIGNEKGKDETDTVGATTLRVEHVDPVSPAKGVPKMITFDFLGKDSMQYRNTNDVSELAYENIVSFRKGKAKTDLLFDRIASKDVNEFLKKFGDGMSAKVIRTYKASYTYYEALKKGAKKGMSKDKLVDLEKRANFDVAKVCNHQKKKSAASEASIEKLKAKMKEIKQKIKDASTDKQKEKAKEQLAKAKLTLQDKERNLEVACGTSKQNYIDPRITVAYAKTHDLDIKKVFTAATLRTRFAWAIENTEADWDYINTPIELPEDEDEEKPKTRSVKKKSASVEKPKTRSVKKKSASVEKPKTRSVKKKSASVEKPKTRSVKKKSASVEKPKVKSVKKSKTPEKPKRTTRQSVKKPKTPDKIKSTKVVSAKSRRIILPKSSSRSKSPIDKKRQIQLRPGDLEIIQKMKNFATQFN